jgi:hypothetical protein
MAKATIMTARLSDLLMKELRKHSECDHVKSVGFTRPSQSAPYPNWASAFTCEGPKIAPPIAWAISRRFQEQYDLVYFPAQNSTPLAFGENHPVGGKLRDRTELNLTSAPAVDSFL